MSSTLEAQVFHYGRFRDRFDREPSGLVNLDEYLPYLIDHPATVPVRPDTLHLAKDRFVFQHAYFTEQTYLQRDLPKEERDRRLVALRNAMYSQIVMRSHMETALHLDKEPDVEPPSEETRDEVLRDYFDLDIVASASYGIAEIRNPKGASQWLMENYSPPPEIQALSAFDREDILAAAYADSLANLADPRVISPKLAASALRRIATALRDQSLGVTADERLEDYDNFYPVGVPREGHLRVVGGNLLRVAVGIRSFEEARTNAQALQTEVDRLKSVA